LSEAQIRKRDEREQEFRSKLEGRDLKKMREKKEAWIKPELLARLISMSSAMQSMPTADLAISASSLVNPKEAGDPL